MMLHARAGVMSFGKMVPSVYLVVKVFIITTRIMSMTTGYCPEQKSSDEPKFTQQLGFIDYVRHGHAIAIPCCAEGYESITWYRQHNKIWQRIPPPPKGDYNSPSVEEKGQLLRIYDAKQTDQTRYRCDVANESKVIQHITDLVVIECDKLPRGPFATSPFPENKTIFEYGGNITLHCTGYFGCHDHGDILLVVWKLENQLNRSIEGISSRYKVEYFEIRNQSVMEARLHIIDVREEDTRRTFMCILADPQQIDGQTNLPVRITRKEIPQIPWLMIGLISGGCVLFVFLVISSVTSLRCLYGPQIRLYLSSRISTLGPRTADQERYSYNLFIYHAVEDEDIAQTIKQRLIDLRYRIYITADIQGNQNVMNAFSEKSARSAMVMFLYSDALREDNFANILIQSFINDRRGRDIMFLEVADYTPREVMTWAQHVRGRNITLERNIGDDGDVVNRNTENNMVAEQIAENADIGGASAEVVNANIKTEIGDDLRFWRLLPRIKVPAEETNKRKMDNFLCSLQNKIPKFDYQKQQTNRTRVTRDNNLSTERPLLGSHQETEPVSPLSRNSIELSPNTDDVFTYDQ